jgi:hypothetical protein
MPETTPAAREKEGDGFDRGFDGHWRRQVRLGLALTAAERLRWLEQTMEELRLLVGRARCGRPVASDLGSSPRGAVS